MKPIYAPISIHSGANGQYQDYPRLCHITGYRAIRIGIKIAALLSFLPFCICPPLCAQEPIPTFSFCTIIDQSMVIDGGSLQFAYIHEVAINDAAEVAFVASRFDGMETDKQGIVYTSRHRIARTGDVKDGWYLAFIDKDAHIAINAKGDVAYEAWYSATKERAAAGAKALGIFINDRLALLLGNTPRTEFALTDDGWVVPRPRPYALSPYADSPFAAFPSNSKHEIAMPINGDMVTFILLGIPDGDDSGHYCYPGLPLSR